MKNFTSVHDVNSIPEMIREVLELKKNPYAFAESGKNKTLGLIFFNASLRTRLSTQKAALNLGMNVIVMNIGSEGWALEFTDGTVMNGETVEHIKDAASVMGLYCDIIGIRSFPTLKNKKEDDEEKVIQSFIQYAKVPIISLESATLHPLQSFADMVSIHEHKKTEHPNIVLAWAPHIKALPQAVSNSFAEWSLHSGYNLTIAQPEGYELNEKFTKGATIAYDLGEAIENADFIYVKNWSSYKKYGEILHNGEGWLLDEEMIKKTNQAKIMHCLPVRRNLELKDELLDSENSLIHHQAENRLYSAQAVLKKILEFNF